MTCKYQVCMEHVLPSDLAESCIFLRGLGETKSPLHPFRLMLLQFCPPGGLLTQYSGSPKKKDKFYREAKPDLELPT